MKRKTTLSLLFPALFLTLSIASCGGDDDNPGPVSQGKCLSDKVTLTQTLVNDLASQHSLQVTFDAKNTGNEDYEVAVGYKAIYVEMKVTTTDNTVYTEEQPLLSSKIGAGATVSVTQSCDYGAGKTFKSYSVRTYCKD